MSVKYIAYHDSVLFVASSKEIKLVTINDTLQSGQEHTVEPEQNEIHTIRPDEHTIHGIFLTNLRGVQQVIVAIETFDNQLDFNILILNEKPTSDGFSY
jgi:hypothetical protein